MQVIERLCNDMPTQYWRDEGMTRLVTMERAVAMVEVWNSFLPKLDLGQLELALRSSIPWDLRAEKPHFQVYVQYTDPCHTSTRVNMFPSESFPPFQLCICVMLALKPKLHMASARDRSTIAKVTAHVTLRLS